VVAGIAAAGAANAVTRLVGLWETDARTAVRGRLATALRGVLFQRLVAGKGAKGRKAEAEIVAGADAAAAA
jgi:Tfp pilus assembly pilus retraction ATPase PilT